MDKIQGLKERKEEIHNELTALKEGLEDGQVFNDEQLASWDSLKSELDEVDTHISTQQRLLSFDPTEKQVDGFRPAVNFSNKKHDPEMALRAWLLAGSNNREFITKEMQEAAEGIKLGNPTLSSTVRWDQTKGTDAKGGYGVNGLVVAGVIQKLHEQGSMLSACTVFNTSTGGDWRYVVTDSTVKAVPTNELATIANVDHDFSEVTFKETKLTTGNYKISYEAIRDVNFDLMGELTSEVAARFARGINYQLTQGAGGTAPQGIEAAVTAITPTTLTYNNIMELSHAVPSPYRRSSQCVYMCNDVMLKTIRQTLIDADGRPLWNQSGTAVEGYPYVMDNHGVVVNPDLSDDTLIFGDFSRYRCRLIGSLSLKILNELFALEDAVGIVGHLPIDGRLVDDTAFAKLVVA